VPGCPASKAVRWARWGVRFRSQSGALAAETGLLRIYASWGLTQSAAGGFSFWRWRNCFSPLRAEIVRGPLMIRRELLGGAYFWAATFDRGAP